MRPRPMADEAGRRGYLLAVIANFRGRARAGRFKCSFVIAKEHFCERSNQQSARSPGLWIASLTLDANDAG